MLFDRVLGWIRDPTDLGRPVLEGSRPITTLAVPMIVLNLIQELRPAEGNGPFYAEETEWCVN